MELARMNYGVKLHPKRHRDLIEQHIGRAEAYARVLKVMTEIKRESGDRG